MTCEVGDFYMFGNIRGVNTRTNTPHRFTTLVIRGFPSDVKYYMYEIYVIHTYRR